MWASAEFAPVSGPFPKVDAFVDQLRPLYSNGKVEHAAFRFPDHPVFEWFSKRNQYHEMGFFECFWRTLGPKSQFQQNVYDLNFYDHAIFSFQSPFQFGGALAWLLSGGGAYDQFQRGGVEAKRIGEEAAFEMLGGDYDSTLVYQSGIAWSDFFWDVAWDYSFVCIDQNQRLIHALLATDTD